MAGQSPAPAQIPQMVHLSHHVNLTTALLAGERLPPAPGNVGGSLAAARRHGDEVEAARQKMLASARERRAAIIEAHQAGMSIRRIAAELGCSPAVVQNAVRAARAESDGDAPEGGSR
jgi:DNA-directed RNA polymerase specialized sigma24 family protein